MERFEKQPRQNLYATPTRNLRRGLKLRIDDGLDATGKAQIERIFPGPEIGEPEGFSPGHGSVDRPVTTEERRADANKPITQEMIALRNVR